MAEYKTLLSAKPRTGAPDHPEPAQDIQSHRFRQRTGVDPGFTGNVKRPNGAGGGPHRRGQGLQRGGQCARNGQGFGPGPATQRLLCRTYRHAPPDRKQPAPHAQAGGLRPQRSGQRRRHWLGPVLRSGGGPAKTPSSIRLHPHRPQPRTDAAAA